MKVKVKKVFKDKMSKELYKINKELDISNERYAEIKEFVEIIKSKNENIQSENKREENK